jgi:hypothetical protein
MQGIIYQLISHGMYKVNDEIFSPPLTLGTWYTLIIYLFPCPIYKSLKPIYLYPPISIYPFPADILKYLAQHCPLPPLYCSNEVLLLLGNPYISKWPIFRNILWSKWVIHELCCKTDKLCTIYFVGLNVSTHIQRIHCCNNYNLLIEW